MGWGIIKQIKVGLEQWISTGVILAPADIWQNLETFLVVAFREMSATDSSGKREARDVDKYPTKHIQIL